MSITRSITRPIVRGITRGIVRSGLDPDAAAYIAAVEAARGSSISGTQKTAIDTFFKTGKSDGWYSSIKRLYLPIWADAAANAIDMVTRTSGTFTLTGVDNTNVGYVQGNGSTGGFTDNASPASVGMTTSGGGLFALAYESPTGTGFAAMVSGVNAASDAVQLYVDGNSIVATVCGTAANASYAGTRATNTGIWVSSRTSPTALALYQRKTSGFSLRASSSVNTTGNTASVSVRTYMNQSGGIYSNGKFGAYGQHVGLSQPAASAFSGAIKNLWETASALTLP